MGMLQETIAGEVVNNLNFSGGLDDLPANFGTVWASVSATTSVWTNLMLIHACSSNKNELVPAVGDNTKFYSSLLLCLRNE